MHPFLRSVSLWGLALSGWLLPLAVEAQEQAVSRFSRGWQGEEALRVTVELSAGTLSVHGAPRDRLYDVQLEAETGRPHLLHQFTPGHLTVGTDWDRDGRTGRRWLGTRDLRSSDVRLDLALGRRMAMDMVLNAGASVSTLDLDQLQLQGLEINLGAGVVEVRSHTPNPVAMNSMKVSVGAGVFEAEGLGFLAPAQMEVAVGAGRASLQWEGLTRPQTQLALSIAIGQVELHIPESVGVSVERSGFLFQFSGGDLQRAGNRWISDNWETATTQLEISVSGALGGLEIVRIDG